MRRIVTGVDERGRSRVISDERLPEEDFLAIWEGDPRGPVAGWIAAVDPARAARFIEPAPGGSRWLLARIPAEAEDRQLRRAEPVSGLEEGGFHTTRTIDYDFVLRGPLVLELDAGSVTLESGDVVVQQATHHAWRNPGREPAVLLAVLVSPGRNP